ncbi:hypothetical protein [Burkholderia sp. SRS-W-2-2016]|nr:hypothetical protein [Burkholderia sp. SRS-W-2-2016]
MAGCVEHRRSEVLQCAFRMPSTPDQVALYHARGSRHAAIKR